MIVWRSLSALGVGVLFGIGLSVSQIANPEKVLAFLNVAADWDGSLLLVMAAATTVTFVGYRWASSGPPLFESQHFLPTLRTVDSKLIAGTIIFGIGWGLAGYCPGPAITSLSSGAMEPVIFVISMLTGSQIGRLAQRLF